MKRGTTAPLLLTIEGVDLTETEWLIVSIRSGGRRAFEFTRDELSLSYENDKTVIALSLSEKQSVGLNIGTCTIDVNWMKDGVRYGCLPSTFDITETLLTRVVDDGD